jgi:hypothetical protein
VTEYLAQRVVDLHHPRLTPERVAEPRFNHVEGAFDVRALVVVLPEPLGVVREVVEYLAEKLNATLTRAVRLERDVREAALKGR